MEIAKGKLDCETFDAIYARAVELERSEMIKPTGRRVEHPIVAEKIATHLNDEVQLPTPHRPHAAIQIERRLDIDVGPADLGNLLRVIHDGGPNVSVIRQLMDLQQHLVVNWRGKHFVVIYSKTRDRLITAYPQRKKRPKKKIMVSRPRDWRGSLSEEDDA